MGSRQWSETGHQQVATKCILRCVALLVFMCASLCGKRSPCSIVASDYRRSHRGITTRSQLTSLRSARADTHTRTSRSWIKTVCGAVTAASGRGKGPTANKQPTGHALLGCTCHTQFASFQLENTLTVPTHLPSLPPMFSSFSLSLALFSGNVRLHLFSKLQIFNQLQGVIFALQISFTHFHRFN